MVHVGRVVVGWEYRSFLLILLSPGAPPEIKVPGGTGREEGGCTCSLAAKTAGGVHNRAAGGVVPEQTEAAGVFRANHSILCELFAHKY